MDLKELRARLPVLSDGLDDVNFLKAVQETYYPDEPFENLARDFKLKMPDAPAPTLGQRFKQGISDTISAADIATTTDPAKIAAKVADSQANSLPQTAVQREMAEEIAPYAKEYQDSSGMDAVGAFAKLAAKRIAQFATNPKEFAGSIVQNLPNSAPGLAGMVAGGAAGSAVMPGAGTAVGAVAGGTAGGFLIERGAAMREQILQEVQKRGIDPRDAKALEPLIAEKYEEFAKAANLKGVGTAGTDAALNVLTMGVAGAGSRAIVKEARDVMALAKAGRIGAAEAESRLAELAARDMARNTVGQKAMRGAAVAGAEMGGESASEAAGQALAYGKVDPVEVIDEGLLGLGQGVGMAAGRGAFDRVTGRAAESDTAAALAAAREATQSILQAPDTDTAIAAAERALAAQQAAAAPAAPLALPAPTITVDAAGVARTTEQRQADITDAIVKREERAGLVEKRVPTADELFPAPSREPLVPDTPFEQASEQDKALYRELTADPAGDRWQAMTPEQRARAMTRDDAPGGLVLAAKRLADESWDEIPPGWRRAFSKFLTEAAADAKPAERAAPEPFRQPERPVVAQPAANVAAPAVQPAAQPRPALEPAGAVDAGRPVQAVADAPKPAQAPESATPDTGAAPPRPTKPLLDGDALEAALTNERDATTQSIENDWVGGKGRRRRTAIESAIYDAVTASTLDADNAAAVVDAALANGRTDLAQYAVDRASRHAESMSTTPGVSPSSPKHEAIKRDLEDRKRAEQEKVAALREKLKNHGKSAAPATAPDKSAAPPRAPKPRATRDAGGVRPLASPAGDAQPAAIAEPVGSDGRRDEDRYMARQDSAAAELAAQVAEEAQADDFDPAEVPTVIRRWAEESKVAADDLRVAFRKALAKHSLPKGRKAAVLRAINPLREKQKPQQPADYPAAKQRRDAAEARARAAKEALDAFPRGRMNLTTDEAKATPEWKKAKAESDAAMTELRAANEDIAKRFAKDDRARRDAEREAKRAVAPAEAQDTAKTSDAAERRFTYLVRGVHRTNQKQTASVTVTAATSTEAIEKATQDNRWMIPQEATIIERETVTPAASEQPRDAETGQFVEKGSRLETRSGQELAAFRRLQGDATSDAARQDAEAILGFASPAPVMRKSDPDLAAQGVPMYYDLDSRTIIYNTAFTARTRAMDAQWMAEEILHAVDHLGEGKTISASSERLAPGGDIRQELEAAYARSGILKNVLAYPLAQQFATLAQDRITAELFARVGVIYHGFPDILRAVAPKTFEAYDAIFRSTDEVPGAVRGGADGRQDADLAGGAASRGGEPRAVQGAAREQGDQQLADLRRRSAQALGGNERGRAADLGGRLEAREAELSAESLREFAQQTKDRFGLSELDLRLTRDGDIRLDTMAANRAGRGAGTMAMEALTAFADKHQRRVTLTLAEKGYQPVEGGPKTSSPERLRAFYKRFGFVDNKGRNKDFTLMESMYREPAGPIRAGQDSTGPAPASGQRAAKLQALADAIAEKWERAPSISVLTSVSSLPERHPVRVEAEARRARGGGRVKAVHYRGEVMLFADALKNEADAAEYILHEVTGHHGLRGHFGRDLDRQLELIVKLRPGDIRKMYERTGVKKSAENDIRMAEEVLAYLAMEQPELGIVKRAIAAIRNWLRENVPGFADMNMSDAELVEKYILPARKYIEGDGKPREDMTMLPAAAGQGAATPDYPMAGEVVSGLRVRDGVPNMGSIAASLNDYEVLSGIREIPFSEFIGPDPLTARTRKLMEEIEESGEIAPLIVVVGDPQGPYILEGAHRFDVLQHMGKATFPAKVVVDLDAPAMGQSRGFTTREIQVDGKWRPIENSKGQIVGRTFEEQANFWKWFQDSAVVDEQSRPMVMYHGTSKSQDGEAFTMFDTYASNYGLMGQGGYFTADPDVASSYTSKGNGTSPTVYPAYLSIKNPIDMDAKANPEAWQAQFPDAEQFHEGGDTNESWYRAAEESIRDQEVPMYEGAEIMQDGLRAMGFDGITHMGGGRVAKDGVRHRVYVAFDPEQVKSATGNRGTFDPESPNIMFGQEDVADARGLNNPRDWSALAREAVAELGGTPGKLHWWHRTVGTQYNLAQRSPAYRRVFDRVQDFLHDVSLYATEAADKAPTILPKLETWRDMTKTALSAKDTKAIGAPIFEGTLAWARDVDGSPVRVDTLEKRAESMSADQKAQAMLRAGKINPGVLKMWQGLPLEQYQAAVSTAYQNRMLRPGVVWTDAELREKFKLDKRQIGLYREFRAAVDKSLTDLAVSDMLRYAGDDAAFVRDAALESGDVMQAASLITKQLDQLIKEQPERQDVLNATAKKITEKAEKARALMDEGYAPLSRFGHYTVDVVGKDGERLYFSLFDNRFEAARMAKKLRAAHPEATVTRGTLSEEAYKLFAGVSPETLELFGEMLGLESTGDSAADKAFQEYLKLAKSTRSAMKRMIHRQGIAGFSEDAGRVLAGFVYSNARQTSRNLHEGEISGAVNDIPKTQGELKDQAVRLADYIRNPVEEAQALRGLLFAQYLGGSIAAAMVNISQPFQVTMPYLSQWAGISGAAKQMKDAVKVAWAKTTGDAELDAALKRAAEEGIVAPQEVHQLMAQAAGKGALRAGDGTPMGDAAAKANNALVRLQVGWGKFFSTAELFNRRVTFVAAYRIAKERGMADPARFAKEAIDASQFVYNKGNRPQWARGAVGSTIFTFKSYGISYIELLSRLWNAGEANSPERAAGRRAVYFGLAMLMLLGGAGGLPFVQDVDDLIDGVMQRLGYNWSTKQKRQELLDEAFGRGMGAVLDRGVSGLPGVPVDVAGRLGLGNLIPGTGLLTKKTDYSRDVLEILGPTGDLASRALQSVELLTKGEPVDSALTASPVAVRNLAKALEMASTGIYTDQRGYKVLDVDGWDALSKGIGFQPTAVSQVQEADRTAQAMVARVRMAESEIAAKWAKGIAEGDSDTIQEARDEVAEWNEKNPEAPIKIKLADVLKRAQKMRQSRAERIEKTAPKEVRAEVGRILRSQE